MPRLDVDEVLRKIHGGAVRTDSGVQPARLATLQRSLGVAFDPEVSRLLVGVSGYLSRSVGWVDLTGQKLKEVVAFEQLFPRGLPLAADGFGNFWIVDIESSGRWGCVFYLSHDPPAICLQFRDVWDFIDASLSEVELRKQAQNLSLRIDQGYVSGIPLHEARESADPQLAAFAKHLPADFRLHDLRQKAVNTGFAIVPYDAQIRRGGDALLFGVRGVAASDPLFLCIRCGADRGSLSRRCGECGFVPREVGDRAKSLIVSTSYHIAGFDRTAGAEALALTRHRLRTSTHEFDELEVHEVGTYLEYVRAETGGRVLAREAIVWLSPLVVPILLLRSFLRRAPGEAMDLRLGLPGIVLLALSVFLWWRNRRSRGGRQSRDGRSRAMGCLSNPLAVSPLPADESSPLPQGLHGDVVELFQKYAEVCDRHSGFRLARELVRPFANASGRVIIGATADTEIVTDNTTGICYELEPGTRASLTKAAPNVYALIAEVCELHFPHLDRRVDP